MNLLFLFYAFVIIYKLVSKCNSIFREKKTPENDVKNNKSMVQSLLVQLLKKRIILELAFAYYYPQCIHFPCIALIPAPAPHPIDPWGTL